MAETQSDTPKIQIEHRAPGRLDIDVPRNGTLGPKALRALAASNYSVDGGFSHIGPPHGWAITLHREIE